MESVKNTDKNIHAVFEGGGVKGTGLVGAVQVTEDHGYIFDRVAGTSAGAIIAALIAAGYTASEMKEIMFALDYRKFKDKGLGDSIPLVGPLASLLITKGIYEGDYFENWLRDLLLQKNIRTFKDLLIDENIKDSTYRYKLQVIASDVSRGRLITLPHDVSEYGFVPNDFDVARAVRMSMSIPFFYKPVIMKNAKGDASFIVDGGILSNYPVGIFDPVGNTSPLWPTFGYKLVEPDEYKPHNINGPVSLLAALFSTMMEAHDARYIKDTNFQRTIPIETLGVQTTDFDTTIEKKQELYESGKKAAEEFFQKWNFEEYNQKRGKGESRRQQVWKSKEEAG
ncbi:MAG: patatin [Candidatus Ryanbacteria bacterium CG10_big_fil_rev_8_21_14_0_10_43_42]|uniref:Patatin n=1 Tax=Candidatus Ryanbacteria bacterium CG10_big_fil_rev_8_21_14_0_10_43_42 TaxID=1974864 RepID=A0A2M8KWX2_9BACT|nr:MAG: patatin [Candidatus Ryanbacteria bacterium CG10_big_fil_rev_8_21_14_0_10_43_42]